jgi:TolB protein
MSDRELQLDIWLVDTRNGELTRLTTSPGSRWHPRISPDGTRIAYVSDPNLPPGIYVRAADSMEARRISPESTHDSRPAWSPDGQELAFISYRDGGDAEIYRMRADGTGATRLTNDPATDQYPEWSPDGRRIAFISDRASQNGETDIYVMNADGSGVTRLTTTGTVATGDLAWSPDGRRLLFTNTIDADETPHWSPAP